MDGIVQPIVAVAEERDTGPVAVPALWMRDVAPDVATNAIDDPRLIVIILDDALLGSDLWVVRQMQTVAREIVAGLGRGDLGSVVFSCDNLAPQDFTSDRAKLLAAIDNVKSCPSAAMNARGLG